MKEVDLKKYEFEKQDLSMFLDFFGIFEYQYSKRTKNDLFIVVFLRRQETAIWDLNEICHASSCWVKSVCTVNNFKLISSFLSFSHYQDINDKNKFEKSAIC